MVWQRHLVGFNLKHNLLFFISGPFMGSVHDSTATKMMGLTDLLEQHHVIEGQVFLF